MVNKKAAHRLSSSLTKKLIFVFQMHTVHLSYKEGLLVHFINNKLLATELNEQAIAREFNT